MTEKMVEEVNERGKKVSEEEEETPSSGVGTWLIVGLSIGVLLCLGIALKRVIKWFKKGKPFCLMYLFSKYFLFQSERECVNLNYPRNILKSSVIFNLLF